MSSQQPAFYFGGQAQNQQTQPPQNYAQAQAPSLTNGAPVVPNQPQEMAFQQRAALPGIDLSALNGINISAEQLMQIAHLIQSGQLTLPLPAPTVNPPPSNLPVPSPIVATAATLQMNVPLPGEENNADMDREEGELEDNEEGVPSAHAHALARTEHSQSTSAGRSTAGASGVNSIPVAPPQSYPAHHTPAASNVESRNGGRPGCQTPEVVELPKAAISASATSAPQPSVAVKAFVLELHRVGYRFEDLAREVGDSQSLRNLYQQIGLPLLPKSGSSLTAAQQNGAARYVDPKADAQRQPADKSIIAVKPIAPVAAKLDRASYLAKLQAAKNRKSEPAAEAQTANNMQSSIVPAAVSSLSSLSNVNMEAPQSATAQHLPTAQPNLAAASLPAGSTAVDSPARTSRFTIDTELVRRKLAKLQAERAEAQNALRMSSDASISDGANLRSPGNAQKQQAEPNATVLPSISTAPAPSPVPADQELTQAFSSHSPVAASPSIARGSGLPGLFTTRTSVQQSSSPFRPPVDAFLDVQVTERPQVAAVEMSVASPVNSTRASLLPRQRPANAQHVPWADPSASNRSFGESGMQNEAFIIETSSDDDDDDGEDMDTDDSTGQLSPALGTMSLPARPVDLLPNFHTSKLEPEKGTSAPGTPAGDLKRKLEEIETAKQKLEAMKRRKVCVKPTAGTPNASMQSPGTALTARSSISLSDGATPSAEAGHQSPSTGAYLSKQQEKEGLRKRLQELESSLGRKLTSASITTLETPQATADDASAHQKDLASGVIDGDEDDDADDGDLYEPETIDSTTNEETLAPAVHVEPQLSDDEDGEIYEPQAFNSATDKDMRLYISSDKGNIRSQGTAHSAITDTDTADARVAAEIDVPTAELTNAKTDIHTNEDEHSLSTHQGLEATGVDRSFSEIDEGVESGEVVDDDSEDMYEPSAGQAPQQSSANNHESTMEVEKAEDEQYDDNEAMDISSDDSDSSSDTSSDESSDDYEPEQNIALDSSALPESLSARDSLDEIFAEPEPVRLSTSDDLAPKLHPAEEQPATAVHSAPNTGFYKPYTSMLSRFKDYRYHPEFINDVPGGHKSLTYSNNIDHEKPICPFEIGGRCNDKDCQYQHFRTMSLSDNDLLKEIGTRKIPAKGHEEEKKWRDGLTAVVKELRNTNRGKDVAVIAQRIAEYRRDFIGDPTKTLILD